MVSFSPFVPQQFKSSFRVLCRVFFESRNRWQQRAIGQTLEIQQLKTERDLAREEVQMLKARIAQCQSQTQPEPQRSWQTLKPLPGHQYSANMIALCCRLCLLVGFRATPKVLKCVSEAFGLDLKIPSRDAVRNWNCRNGVGILQEPTKADDWIWLIDHSVQLGKMFVLTVLGIRRGDLPVGRSLTRQDMSVLAVMPTTSRSKEEVSAQLGQVAERFGKPLAVVCDGASELREGVTSLKEQGIFTGICLSDVKHRIANLLKKEFGSDERWKKFDSHLGTTTAVIQQTELEHLMPPRKKLKCRFMNFDRLIDWATNVTDYLKRNPSTTRLIEKLGWLHEFTDDLKSWQQVRRMISVVLCQANEQGVWIGASTQLRKELMKLPAETVWAEQLRERLIEIVASNEAQLEQLKIDGVRLPCSTEVLESAFGAFKAIQRHHTRGTFTTLLATFPTLFDKCTGQKIRQRLSRVSNQALAQWWKSNGLTDSTQSRRMLALHPI